MEPTPDVSKYHLIVQSYLGDTPSMRRSRMETLQQQLKCLTKMFPNHRVLVVCSGYTSEERKQLDDYETFHFDKRLPQWRKQGKILKALRKVPNKAIIIFDDDVLPEVNNEYGIDVISQLEDWLNHPSTIPCPLLFFSSKSLLQDAFTKNRKPEIVTCPYQTSGSMMLCRSDLKSKITKKEFRHFRTGGHVCLDVTLRNKTAAVGQPVGKHLGIFFRSFPGTVNRSLIASSREDRLKFNKATDEHLMHVFPWLYLPSKNKRPFPVWRLRGSRFRDYVEQGLLKITSSGIIYPSRKLKEVYKRKTSFSLNRIIL